MSFAVAENYPPVGSQPYMIDYKGKEYEGMEEEEMELEDVD